MREKKSKRLKNLSPVQLIVLSFVGVIFVGTLLLSLPIASTTGETSLIDALFVATSSVCVTGLTTVNTAAHWSLFGRVVILCLIEIGGMSFMLMTLFFTMVVGKKINFGTRLVLKEAMNLDEHSGVLKLGLYVLKFSFSVQLIGAILLLFSFGPKYGFWKGLGYSLFHAISAFCNAGFDLFGDSLESMRQDSYVILVLAGLIIAGGFGFVVWREVLNWFKTKKMSIHSRLALKVMAVLLVGGFLLFLLIEKNLAAYSDELSFGQRLVNTFFLTVTPRTAGFNSVPYADLSDATLIVTMILMFIGGNSGSTAGGLKTSTLGVLALYAWASIHGREVTVYRERTINRKVIMRAFALFFISISIAIGSITLLSMTETIPIGFGIEYVAFEVFSAFGTVGVTMGLTPGLTLIGKGIIILLMFIGRVGVYTFLLAIARRQKNNEALIRYPEEHIMVG
ncbi:TrkH family potassium uptake protein [uncultured Vagococcus sp.]|uniref:TrkH family potassium uptake protein n=1 Tax=uncultured Vagococcus sp. TaxID=189676 RepID=UPI0028D7B213|nr:TrkH family potassium uptake protein [uncultured Vagococcus sp.]